MKGEIIEIENAKKSAKRLAEDLAKKLQEARKIDRAHLDAELRVAAEGLVSVLRKESGSELWLGGSVLYEAISCVRRIADEYENRAQLYDRLLHVDEESDIFDVPF
jgi:hypothetical protein